MADQKKQRTTLLTPKFRVNFPKVWAKETFQEGQTARYSCVAMFTPSEFSEKDKELWKNLQSAVNQACLDVFKKGYKELKQINIDSGNNVYKLPFHKGEEKADYKGFGPGIIFFTMSAYTRRPSIHIGPQNYRLMEDGSVVDKDGNEIKPEGSEEFYSGCYARASVNPFGNLKWKSVSIGMNNLKKLGDGERLDGFSSGEDDFGGDPDEYDSADDSDIGGGGDDDFVD